MYLEVASISAVNPWNTLLYLEEFLSEYPEKETIIERN